MNGRVPLRILVAEDNRLNQVMMLDLLQHFGYEVDLAENGLEALEMVKQKHYDVVLMDIQMPKMDGLEACHRLIERFPQPERPYLIAITALGSEYDRQNFLDAGLDDYLVKPVKMAELRATLEQVLIRQPTLPENPGGAQMEKNLFLQQTTTNETPLIDMDALKTRLGPLAESILDNLMPFYLEDTPPILETIDRTLKIGDSDGLWKSAHALKGASSTIGLDAMAGLCAELECLGKQADFEAAATKEVEIVAMFERVKMRWRQVLSQNNII